jgi:isopenicillin N synthase-like dioxygenase
LRKADRPQLPRVRLSDLVQGTEAERKLAAKTLGDGLRKLGLVAVEGHGVPEALMRQVYAEAKAFFHLPVEQKRAYQDPLGGRVGYTGVGEEHARRRKLGDLKEFWHVARELPEGQPTGAGRPANVWPTETPGLRKPAVKLYGALESVALHVLRGLAVYFAVPESTFTTMVEEGNSILRVIRYPALEEAFVPGAVRSAEHEDVNLITLMPEATAPGLQVLTRDGEWIDADGLKGAMLVIGGDMLARITNDVISATTLRVLNPEATDAERYAMPFFVHPRARQVLTALELKGYPAKAPSPEPITAEDFLKARLREIGLLRGGSER